MSRRDVAYGRPHRRDRAGAVAAMVPGAPCPACRRPMFRSPAEAIGAGVPAWMGLLDYDHMVPLRLGGDPHGPKRTLHRSCNRRLGQQITAAILRAKRAAGIIPEWPGRPGTRQPRRMPSRRRERW